MKYLFTFGSVTVTGPPFLICSLNNGITDPEEFMTFPNLTAENIVLIFEKINFQLPFLIAF